MPRKRKSEPRRPDAHTIQSQLKVTTLMEEFPEGIKPFLIYHCHKNFYIPELVGCLFQPKKRCRKNGEPTKYWKVKLQTHTKKAKREGWKIGDCFRVTLWDVRKSTMESNRD